MERSFWQSRWNQGQIGFHRPDVNPNLTRHLSAWLPAGSFCDSRVVLAEQRVFVPLAGKTRDVAWLAANGASVVAVEFVEQAVKSYFDDEKLEPAVCTIDVGLRFVSPVPKSDAARCHGTVEFLVSDFFALEPKHVGSITAVYDRAAMVAINTDRRAEYAARLAHLTPQGARLLLVSFEHNQDSGPPFSVPAEQVGKLLSPWFDLAQLSDDDILEDEPRFKARGMTYLREQVWLGSRK
jgi:thiopurine S-methyltransferase